MDLVKIFNNDVSISKYEEWLQQFEQTEIPYIEKLITNFNYFSFFRVQKHLSELYDSIMKAVIDLDNVIFVPVGYVVKSGSVVAYFFRKVNQLRENQFLPYSELNANSLNKIETIVFLDDYIGTGHQSINVWRNIKTNFDQLEKFPKLIYATIVGYTEGVNKVEQATDFKVITSFAYGPDQLPFHPDSKIFNSENELSKAKEIISKYGQKLYPKYPLGYKDNSGLFSFFYSTPNNTLPIFWSIQNNWTPLLPRGDDFRDPQYLVGPEIDIPSNLTFKGFEETYTDDNLIDRFDIDPNITIKLTQELKNTQLLLIVIPIIKELGLNEHFVNELLNIINGLKSEVHEHETVSSAIFISHESELRKLEYYLVTDEIKIDNYKEIIELANQTNGFGDALAFDTNGKVLGAISYIQNGSDLSFIPKKLQSAVKFTKSTPGLLILFEGDNRINLIWEGQRLISFRKSSWHLSPSNLNKLISKLSTLHSIDIPVIEKLISVAIEMSHIGEGGLITIGDADSVLKLSTPKSNYKIKLGINNILRLGISQTINIISQDGASIISNDGNILQHMTTLRPPPNIEIELETGIGTKHQTAQIVSHITDAITIAISVDYNFTIFSKGKKIYRMNG